MLHILYSKYAVLKYHASIIGQFSIFSYLFPKNYFKISNIPDLIVEYDRFKKYQKGISNPKIL